MFPPPLRVSEASLRHTEFSKPLIPGVLLPATSAPSLFNPVLGSVQVSGELPPALAFSAILPPARLLHPDLSFGV